MNIKDFAINVGLGVGGYALLWPHVLRRAERQLKLEAMRGPSPDLKKISYLERVIKGARSKMGSKPYAAVDTFAWEGAK